MLIIDAHVHIYNRFDLNTFFEATFRNFRNAAERHNFAEFTSILFIADWSNVSWFRNLAKLCDTQQDYKNRSSFMFRVHKTDEPNSLRVTNEKSDEVLVIAGRKIITSEDLEVLALCSQDDIHDEDTLENTLKEVIELGAVPVIPWAVGKWLGERGRVLDNLIDMRNRPFFYLCDNGNRPYFWGWPSHFKRAEQRNIPIISGSDPLHFAHEASRAGKFGFTIPAHLSPYSPANDIRAILLNPETKVKRYGRLERFWPFFANQIRMQLFKKKWRKELLK